jgi:hypothetical protein
MDRHQPLALVLKVQKHDLKVYHPTAGETTFVLPLYCGEGWQAAITCGVARLEEKTKRQGAKIKLTQCQAFAIWPLPFSFLLSRGCGGTSPQLSLSW